MSHSEVGVEGGSQPGPVTPRPPKPLLLLVIHSQVIRGDEAPHWCPLSLESVASCRYQCMLTCTIPMPSHQIPMASHHISQTADQHDQRDRQRYKGVLSNRHCWKIRLDCARRRHPKLAEHLHQGSSISIVRRGRHQQLPKEAWRQRRLRPQR